MSGVNFCAALMLPLILIAPLHISIIHQPKQKTLNEKKELIKKSMLLNSPNLMKAICGFVLPVEIPRKSLSVKEKVASGFP
jgi:hypothetical protein